MLDFSSICLLFGSVVGSAVAGVGGVVIAYSWVRHAASRSNEQ
jgi:hypothetical protein